MQSKHCFLLFIGEFFTGDFPFRDESKYGIPRIYNEGRDNFYTWNQHEVLLGKYHFSLPVVDGFDFFFTKMKWRNRGQKSVNSFYETESLKYIR